MVWLYGRNSWELFQEECCHVTYLSLEGSGWTVMTMDVMVVIYEYCYHVFILNSIHEELLYSFKVLRGNVFGST